VFRHERYSCKVDVYAFGMIAHEIFEGLYRCEDPAAHAAAAAAKSAPFRPDLALLAALGSKRCLEVAALIRRCWDADPNKRPGFAFITADVREIRKLKEYDMPEGVTPPGRRSTAAPKKGPSAMPASAPGGAAAPAAAAPPAAEGCCVVQ
jgi:hypothetical protein